MTGIISRWGSIADRKLFVFDDCREEIDSYLQAVDEIQRKIDSADSSDERKEAESVLRIAMSRLSDEFRNILKVDAKSISSLNPNLNTESTTMTDSASSNYEVYEDDYINLNKLSSERINDLRSIAMRMNFSGYSHECLNVYVSERKSAIDAGLKHLNIEKLSRNSVRRLKWGVVESKIKIWIKAAKICFKYYFDNEKRLCEQIFHDFKDNTADSCFIDTVKDHTIQLLDIAEALSSIRPASERLFKILDLHDTLTGLQPSINKLFHTQSSESLRTKPATQILPKLADTANQILLTFENSLVEEQSPVVHTEKIHRLPKYVMHYVYKLCDHKQTLMKFPLSNPPSMDAARVISGQTQFSVHVVWIVMSLVSNLEAKARLCEDPSSSRLFAMNNLHYITQKMEGRHELMEVIGDDNFNKLIDKFEQAKGDFLKLTLKVVLKCLRDEGLKKSGILSFRVSRLTERLKRFNGEFEKLEKDLAALIVPDFGIVLELRESISKMVVPAYMSFLVHIKSVPYLEKYVKHSVEGLESAIQDFFVCSPNQ